MSVVAFDSKEFRREKREEKKLVFHCPLGVGVQIKEPEEFKEEYIRLIASLAEDFKTEKRGVYSSEILREKLSLRQAIPFCEKVILGLQNFINTLHVTFVALPARKEGFEVSIGGHKSYQERIKPGKFIRMLSSYFSYVTAWDFFGKRRENIRKICIDGFQSKETLAWNDLIRRCTPTIYFKGDECNPFVSLADILAFMTDVKLYTSPFRKITPDNIKAVWEDYGFTVEVRVLGVRLLSKYKWGSDREVDVSEYMARPTFFLVIEPSLSMEKLRYTKRYGMLATYVAEKDGCIHGLEIKHIETQKIRDGDIILYIGERAKEVALSLKDIFDVEIYSFREFIQKIEEKSHYIKLLHGTYASNSR